MLFHSSASALATVCFCSVFSTLLSPSAKAQDCNGSDIFQFQVNDVNNLGVDNTLYGSLAVVGPGALGSGIGQNQTNFMIFAWARQRTNCLLLGGDPFPNVPFMRRFDKNGLALDACDLPLGQVVDDWRDSMPSCAIQHSAEQIRYPKTLISWETFRGIDCVYQIISHADF